MHREVVGSAGLERFWALVQVIEAEQDPAKAAPRLYAEKAYQYVNNLLF